MQYKHERLVPLSKIVEGGLPLTKLEMPINLLKALLPSTNQSTKCQLTKSEKILFNKFYQEQQRLTHLAELKYLRAYLLEQRATVNKMAAFIKKRDEKEIRQYGKLPLWILNDPKANRKANAPVSKFKVSNDIKDLNAKIATLDKLITDYRSMIDRYELTDYERHESTIARNAKHEAYMNRKFNKLRKMRKVA